MLCIFLTNIIYLCSPNNSCFWIKPRAYNIGTNHDWIGIANKKAIFHLQKNKNVNY